METSFIWTLLQISLTTAVVIGLLLALVPLLRKRYAARWRYWVWLLVVVRLLVPFNLPLPQAPVQITVPQTFTAQPAPAPNTAQPNIPAAEPMPEPTEPHITPAGLVTTVWLLGVAGSVLAQTVVYVKFRRRIKYSPAQPIPVWMEALWQETGAAMGVARLPALRLSTAAPAPILTGLVRPVLLLLPHSHYGREELGLILRHELVHHRRKDLWYRLLLTGTCCVHWFNPLVHLMAAQAGRDIELSCDDKVMAGLGEGERAVYGEAILRALPMKPKGRLEPALTTSFGGTKTSVKQRLKNLFDHTAKKRGLAALCAVLVMVALAGGLVACTSSPASASLQGESDGSQASQPSQQESRPSQSSTPPQQSQQAQDITLELAELRVYSGGGRYIYSAFTNNTNKTITAYEQGMMAFDEDGQPLKMHWNPFGDGDATYYYLYDWADDMEIPPGAVDDSHGGGWSLSPSFYTEDGEEVPQSVLQAKYFLLNLKQVTFADGTVWRNPDYDSWLKTYEGQPADVAALESYYPFVMPVSEAQG